MLQRLMIAMGLALSPALLVADEPVTALDVTIQAQILDLLKDLRDRTEAAVLLITHDMGVVAETCDRVLVMYLGRVVEEAPVGVLFDQPLHPYTQGCSARSPGSTRRSSGSRRSRGRSRARTTCRRDAASRTAAPR
jgi:peptide/nickel transport system ATP-binding protein